MGALTAVSVLLLQATLAPPDSAELARLGARLEHQNAARIRVGDEWAEITRPRLVESSLAYRGAFFDRIEANDSVLANPLPLAQVSVVQVRGRRVLPSIIGGSLSIGLSTLASVALTSLINPNTGPEGSSILTITLIGFGAGAALGALDGALRLRWVTVYRRSEERRGGDSNPR